MSLKQYNVEAYATHTLIGTTRVINVGEKMPCIMTQETLDTYRDFMRIEKCEEIIVDVVTKTNEEVVEVIKPKRQYNKKKVESE